MRDSISAILEKYIDCHLSLQEVRDEITDELEEELERYLREIIEAIVCGAVKE